MMEYVMMDATIVSFFDRPPLVVPFRGKLLFVAPYFHEVLESEKMDQARN